ncbi:hypothetical protein EV426DRAFT_588846 [Tirmania nivea]|nr:hypothetical protein EV426DRAFT_588846 [Tirmania nivea]
MTTLGAPSPTPPLGPTPPTVPSPVYPPPISTARQNLILALRYVVSPKEYASLRKTLKFRAPTAISSSVPSRREFDAVIKQAAARSVEPGETSQDVEDYDFLPSATRAAIRAFLLTRVGLAAWGAIEAYLEKRKGIVVSRPKHRRFRSPATRSAFSLALLLFLHRLLSRFFTTLRSNLLLPSARTFRKRHPKATRLLTSRISPALGASLAGIALAVHPEGEMRNGVAVWVICKALEYAFNLAEGRRVWGERPWWFGSWLLFPLSQAQIFHALIFDRETLPNGPKKFILNFTGDYIPARPETYPALLRWPPTDEVLDGVANIANLHYPKFTPPILNPSSMLLPPPLTSLSPITSTAHPLHTRLHCALTHPSEPSCLTTYITHLLNQLPRLSRFFFILYLLAALPKIRVLAKVPFSSTGRIIRSSVASAAFISGVVGTSWAGLCAMQRVLPGKVGAGRVGARVYLAGAVGGLWAFVQAFGSPAPPGARKLTTSTTAIEDGNVTATTTTATPVRRGTSRAAFTYTARLALVSLWKTGVKRGWWRGVKNGDVVLFVLGLAAMGAVWEAGGEVGVSEGYVREGLEMLKGGKRAEEDVMEGRVEPVSGKEKRKAV